MNREKTTLELTPEDFKWADLLQQDAIWVNHDMPMRHAQSLAQRILALKPVDPRTMVAGPELDRRICKVMGEHATSWHACRWWSTSLTGAYIGPMLNKLTAWGYRRGMTNYDGPYAWAHTPDSIDTSAKGATDSEALGRLLLLVDAERNVK